jgi:two-component system, NarL family, nitrate/nitrite response regulator NarL
MTAPQHQRTPRMVIRSERRLFRDALAMSFQAQPECTVVGHVGRLDDLRSLCRLRRPDIALVDVGTGQFNLECLRDCAGLTKIVVVYERLPHGVLGDLCRMGVDTVLPSSHGLDALLSVLRRYLAANRDRSAEDGFTDLEKQVITLVSAGHTVHQIAQLLEISTSTVANTKRRIYRKLQVVSQGQAVARATALGIVAEPPAPPEYRPAGTVLAVLRGTTGPAWHQVTAALLAGGIPFTMRPETGSLIVLVDPAAEDWPTGRETGVPVVLVRTVAPRRAEVLEALLRGSRVVMTAGHVANDLVPALTLASHGHVTIEVDAANGVLDAVRGPSADPGLPELTSRELDILRLIANGYTMRQTARALGIAVKTVENTQSRLYRKLGARNRASALGAAHALGLLELSPSNGHSG